MFHDLSDSFFLQDGVATALVRPGRNRVVGWTAVAEKAEARASRRTPLLSRWHPAPPPEEAQPPHPALTPPSAASGAPTPRLV